MAQLSENYKDLKKENKELKDSNKVLCEEVNSLKTRVRLAEQYSRKCNVEIQGIPVTTNEDAVSLATDVGAALGVVLSAEDVMAAHRVPTFRPRAAPPLVVQLRDRRMKETIVAAYKKKKELKASEINKVFTNNKVYVNDHLTPETKNLLRLTKEKSRQEWWGTGVSHSAKKPIRQSACKHSIPTATKLGLRTINLGTNGLKVTTTNGRAGGLLERTGSLSDHPSYQQPRSTLHDNQSCDNP
ncbi:hypothetical protein J6590_072786 [Homalodisca vitripennis]|nr:hypothetical protein J6590_072786 [Homalodisca vitripennis]